MNLKLKRFKINIKCSIAVIVIASLLTTYLMFKVSPDYSAIFLEIANEEKILLHIVSERLPVLSAG